MVYNPNFDKIKARKELRKEEKKLKEARKEILSIADTEYKLDLKSDIEDVKRAKNNVEKEEAIERAHRRRKTRGKVYSANRAKRKAKAKGGVASLARGGQGYADREDESLGMRTGAERTKSQSMRDRRDESYGAWGKRPNQSINRKDGGVGSKGYGKTNKSDAMEMATEAMMTTAAEGMIKALVEKAPDITTKKHDITEITIEKVNGEDGQRHEMKKKVVKQEKAKGGVASFARGGVEAADKEGDRLSISMERQEDAGFSPSQADFDQQHRLAEEGIMDVGAAVTIVQGHNSREKLGETDGVRGTGAMVKGTKFRGTF